MKSKSLQKIFLNESSLLKLFFLPFIFIAALFILKVPFYNYFPDFSIYYYASRDVLHGVNPYLDGKHFFSPFIYPPTSILFFIPFAVLPFFLAEKLFSVLSIFSFILSIFIWFKATKIHPFSAMGLCVIFLTLLYFPEKFTLGMGQINNIIFLALSLSVYSYLKKRNALCGMFLSIALLLKLFPVLLLLFFVVRKRWKILYFFCVGSSAIFVFTSIVVGFQLEYFFFTKILPDLFHVTQKVYYNQALSGFFIRSFGNSVLANEVRIALTIFMILGTVYFIWRYKKNDTMGVLSISLLINLSLLTNTFSWQHHFVWLLASFLVTVSLLYKSRLGKGYYILLIFSYILVAMNMKNPSNFPTLFQSHVLYGGFILYFLDMYLLLRNPLKNKTKSKV